MNKKNESLRTQTGQAASIEMMQVFNSVFPVEIRNGILAVNLTAMGKVYGDSMRPANWLKTDEAKRYLHFLSDVLKIASADLLEVRRGGTPGNQGTWCYDARIAMRYAQWLDMKFAIHVDEVLLNLLIRKRMIEAAPEKYGTKGIVWDGRAIYPYADIVRSLGGSSRGGTTKRRAKYPQHFVKILGRNFITPEYADLLHGYYSYRNAQLSINFQRGHA